MLPTMGRHGQGTVVPEKRGEREAFRVAVTMPDGRRLYRRAWSEEEAQRIRAELLQRRADELRPADQTLEGWLRSWLTSLRDAKRQRVKPRTLDHYELIVERHIIPALGSLRLSKLRERHVQEWLDADTGAPRTIHHHRAVLRRALNVAVRQRILDRNPAVGVELPDATGFKPQPLSLAEARALLDATAGDRLGPLWRLAIDTGLREGELLAIGRDDFDEHAGTVNVRGQLQRRAGAWVITSTKAARTSPVLALSPATAAALARHKARMAAERTAEWRYFGHLFVTSNGEPYHGAEVLKAFKAACRKAKVRERRFHDLRATADTLMAEAGVPEHVRMARLGHSTTRMARHYTAVREVLDREAAAALGRVLEG